MQTLPLIIRRDHTAHATNTVRSVPLPPRIPCGCVHSGAPKDAGAIPPHIRIHWNGKLRSYRFPRTPGWRGRERRFQHRRCGTPPPSVPGVRYGGCSGTAADGCGVYADSHPSGPMRGGPRVCVSARRGIATTAVEPAAACAGVVGTARCAPCAWPGGWRLGLRSLGPT